MGVSFSKKFCGKSPFKKDKKRFKTKEEKEHWDKVFYKQWKEQQEKDQGGIYIT